MKPQSLVSLPLKIPGTPKVLSSKINEPTMLNDLFSSAAMDPQTPEIRNEYRTNPSHHVMLWSFHSSHRPVISEGCSYYPPLAKPLTISMTNYNTISVQLLGTTIWHAVQKLTIEKKKKEKHNSSWESFKWYNGKPKHQRRSCCSR